LKLVPVPVLACWHRNKNKLCCVFVGKFSEQKGGADVLNKNNDGKRIKWRGNQWDSCRIQSRTGA
jgi:hypothetical protein